jgi:serine O-acetyltransferase
LDGKASENALFGHFEILQTFMVQARQQGKPQRTVMANPREKVSAVDPIWTALRQQAEAMAGREPTLAGFVHATILQHDQLEQALSYHLARKLGGEDLSPLAIREMFDDAAAADDGIGLAVRADLSAVFERDPACHSYLDAFLFYKGFHALESYRVAHWLWQDGRKAMALFLQSRISQLFAVDVHPAAEIGRGIMFDHATGIVIGERGGGRRCFDHAGRHARRHRQGKR